MFISSLYVSVVRFFTENVLDMLTAGGFITTHGRHRIFLTVHDAVVYCLSGKAMVCSYFL